MPQESFEDRLRRLAGPPSAPIPSPTPAPTPGRALSFEERLAQVSQPQQPPQQPQPSLYERLKKNVGLAAEQGYTALKDKAAALGEIIGGASVGDFRPAIEAAQIAGRGLQRTATSLFGQAALTSPEFGPPTVPIEQVPAIVEGAKQQQVAPMQAVQAQRAARRRASGDTSFERRAAEMARLEAEAQAFDGSLSGRLTRGAVRESIKLLPTIVAGAVSGGSIPAITATTAASSLDEPENLPLATTLAALPVPSVRAIRQTLGPAVSKLFGRGAQQLVEAEASGSGGLIRAMGPSAEEASIRAASALPQSAAGQAVQQTLPGMEQAVAEAAGQVPQSALKKVAENLSAAYHVPRSVMASADVSAPFRQGAIFTISNPRMAARAAIEMFRAFRSKNFERIGAEIAANADARLGQTFGLHLGTQAKTGLSQAEEAFISKWAGKIPIVKQSEQAYTTYLDVLRTQKFAQYRKLIDEAGLGAAETQRAYAAAARWINYATGRGSLGETGDKLMPALQLFLFAPRFAASRLNVLNPIYYAKNAATPGGRVILRQQMKELFTFASVVGSTMALLKYGAGADVTLNPNDSDFGKIKFGRYRYDLAAGLTQALKLIFRTSAAASRVVQGEPAERGKTIADVWGRYLRSKLGPVPSWFIDATEGRTYIGREYSTGRAIRERILPIQWNDWIDAGWEDGIGGILKVSPGLIGIGTEAHDADSLLNRAAPLFSEYTRLGRASIPSIDKLKGEDEATYQTRLRVFSQALEVHGMGLINSPEYKSASAEQQRESLNLLPRRISTALIREGQSWQLAPRQLLYDARESLQNERAREPRPVFGLNGERLR